MRRRDNDESVPRTPWGGRSGSDSPAASSDEAHPADGGEDDRTIARRQGSSADGLPPPGPSPGVAVLSRDDEQLDETKVRGAPSDSLAEQRRVAAWRVEDAADAPTRRGPLDGAAALLVSSYSEMGFHSDRRDVPAVGDAFEDERTARILSVPGYPAANTPSGPSPSAPRVSSAPFSLAEGVHREGADGSRASLDATRIESALATDGSVIVRADPQNLLLSQGGILLGRGAEPPWASPDATPRPRYAPLVAVVAVICLAVPIALFFLLRRAPASPTNRSPSKVANQINEGDPPRTKVGLGGQGASGTSSSPMNGAHVPDRRTPVGSQRR